MIGHKDGKVVLTIFFLYFIAHALRYLESLC